MAKDRTEGLPEPMTFQADANSRRKKGVQRPVFAEVFQVDGVSAEETPAPAPKETYEEDEDFSDFSF